MIVPLPLDDEVHTLSKIMPLWGIADDDDIRRFGMDGALLGHTGVATTVANFLRGFVVLGDGDTEAWTEERLAPLEEFIFSLRAPDNPNPPDGARGSSRQVYSFEEIGSDEAMRRWLDPDLDGQPCCDVDLLGRDELTHGLRAQRLVGLWSEKRFMHNGSIDSLEDLFCMECARPTIAESPFSDRGHMFTCDGLEDAEKTGLIAYLRFL